jgi:RNA-binding protein
VNVIAPTNPRKQSLMASGPLRRALRAAGHHLGVVVQIGKGGVTEAVLAQLDEALLAHELVKVKVGSESPEDRFEAAARLAAVPDTHLAQIIGRTLLVYRRHPERPRFEPEARPASPPADRRGPARGRGARPTARPAARGRPRTRTP